jgi:hypothetical protein
MCEALIHIQKLQAAHTIDLKLLWNNSKTKKTSFLGIPDAGYRSVVFAVHHPEKPNSELSISPYETTNKLVRMFKPTPPKSNNAEVAADGEQKGGFIPIAEAANTAPGEELF